MLNGVLSREHYCAGSSARAGGYGLAYGLGILKSLGIELRVQQHVKRLGVYLHKGFFFGYHALVYKVAGDLYGGGSSTLAVAGLEHIELAVFYGELHILHIVIMVLKGLADVHELLERLRELLLHLADGHGSAHAGNDVFTLSVGQEFAEEALAAGSGRTGERNAGAAIITHVAKRHHLHVDRSTPGIGNVVVHAVYIGTRIVP